MLVRQPKLDAKEETNATRLHLIKLKNGSEVPLPLAITTMMSLEALLKKDPIAFCELVEKARNTRHVMFGNTQEVASRWGLMDSTGSINSYIKDVISSSVSGKGLEMYLQDPVGSQNDVIPPELYPLIKETAKRGFMSSFLLTGTESFITEYLTVHRYSREHIYWINESIKALALIYMGSSTTATIASPIANYLLTNYVGLSQEKANYLVTGGVVACSLMNSDMGYGKMAMATAVGMGASMLGSKVSHYSYHLIRDYFFAPRKPREKEDTHSIDQNSKSELIGDINVPCGY